MMTDDDECRKIVGMTGKGNRSTQRKPAPMPLCPLQILLDLNQAQTQAAAVESWQQTT
jgi:hypothetical protein